MKKLDFPLLTKDDIEVRIGQMNKDQTKASLLLYKTSRTDADILDRVVGQGNWQKKFYVLQGVGIGDNMRSIVVCSVGIYDEDKHEWIWKDDSGTESNVEQDKGVCSDAFKRASGGSCWGIGRELYSAPTIWVNVSSKYDKFQVASISYDENRQIKTLEISNEKGEIVYSYGLGRKVSNNGEKQGQNTTTPPKASHTPNSVNDDYTKNMDKIRTYIGSLPADTYSKFFNWLESTFSTRVLKELTADQVSQVVKALKL